MEGQARDPGRVTELGVAERAAPGQLDGQLVTVSIHDRLLDGGIDVPATCP